MHESFAQSLVRHAHSPRARALAFVSALSVALGAAALSPTHARACSCMAQTQADAQQQAVAIFEGHVVEVKAPPGQEEGVGDATVRMKIVRAWKGMESEETEVMTAVSSATCGYNFEVGKSYLVYAGTVDGKLNVSLCSRTAPIAQADEDLQALGLGATTVNPRTPPGDVAPQQSAPEEPPARGGCAGCSSTGSAARSAGGPALTALCALLLVTCRRRSGSRS